MQVYICILREESKSGAILEREPVPRSQSNPLWEKYSIYLIFLEFAILAL